MKLNLKTVAYMLFALQFVYWAQTGFTLPEGTTAQIVLYEIGCHIPMIAGIIIMIVEVIRIKRDQ